MKKLTAVTVLLAAMLFFGQAGDLSALEIVFDGYNDGVSIEIYRGIEFVNVI